MNCKTCGSPLTENDQFCKTCGAAVNAQNAPTVPPVANNQPMNAMPETPTSPVAPVPVTQPQPVPVTQPVVNSTPASMNSATTVPEKKQNNNVKYIMIGLVAIVAIVAGLIIFKTLSQRTEPTAVQNPEPTVKTYKVDFKGFTFAVPDNLVYKLDTDAMYIGDEADTWYAQVEVEQGSFDKLKAKKGQLHTALIKAGLPNVKPAEEKTLGGLSYLTMEASASGTNVLAGITKVNAMYFAFILSQTKDNELDYKVLENIAPIISSATPSNTTNNMSPDVQVSGKSFGELAQ